MSAITLNSESITTMIDHYFNANETNLKLGRSRISLNIEGEPGLGKTALVNQYAKSKDMEFVQLNLAQIEELSDLIGYPIKEYKIQAKKKDSEGNVKFVSKWVPEVSVNSFVTKGWSLTNENRMGYAQPEWIQGKTDRPGILFLDDFTRASQAFLQATMQLIQHGEYLSWSLPNNWMVLLSSNPDDGEHSVNSVDSAQSSRYSTYTMGYNEKAWAKWAESEGIDGRAINFLLMYREAVVVTDDQNVEKIAINPRRWVSFFNTLVNIDNYEENLPLIRLIGEASVGSVGTNLFVTFINNKLDRLIAPEEILLGDTDTVVAKLKEIIGHGDTYKSSIASALSTRYVNYTLMYFKDKPLSKEIADHMEALFTNEVFGADVNYSIIHNLFNKNKTKFAKLLVKKAIVDAIN
jgi:hypothetical protein